MPTGGAQESDEPTFDFGNKPRIYPDAVDRPISTRIAGPRRAVVPTAPTLRLAEIRCQAEIITLHCARTSSSV